VPFNLDLDVGFGCRRWMLDLDLKMNLDLDDVAGFCIKEFSIN